ncbi:MAG: D-inositol-3-phosphate glycosyltransferase [Myxococcota bacterium]|nr:D-inositol-3-phosphate glycosyltransferase [Myxococcota bacterium]
MERILAVRAGPSRSFDEGVARLRQEHPGAELDVLLPEGAPPPPTEVGHVFRFSGERLTWKGVDSALVRSLRERRHQLAWVTLPSRYGARFAAVRWLLLRLGIPQIQAVEGASASGPRNRVDFALESIEREILLRATVELSDRLDDAGLAVLLPVLLAVGNPAARTLRNQFIHPEEEGARRLRMVLLIHSLGLGGAQRQVIATAEHLDRRRYDIQIWRLEDDDRFFEGRAAETARLWTSGEFSRAVFLPKLRTVFELARRLRDEDIDILHSFMPAPSVLGTAAAAIAGTPRVFTGVRTLLQTCYPWLGARERWMDRMAARIADANIGNSQAVVDDFAAWTGVSAGKLALAPNAIEIPELDAASERRRIRDEIGIPQDAPVVCMVGRLAEEKGHQVFFGAMERLLRDLPQAHALVAGGGELMDSLSAHLREKGLDKSVHLLGPRKDALSVMAASEVIALASRVEGLPNVLIEAALLGVPAVSTRAGGAVEVVDDGMTGWLVSIGDSAAMAERLLHLLNHPEERKAMGEAARQRARIVYSVDGMVKRLHHLYTT